MAQIEDVGITLTYKHCCNSAAIAWFREAYGTHVRSCSSILGHMAMEDGREPIGLEEPLEIGAYITNIHSVSPGETIGYSRFFKVEKPMKVATLSIGFADGFYPKWMRGGGPVLISGVKTRFLGCCMDQSFADVTGIPCSLGQKAILIGRDGDQRITTWIWSNSAAIPLNTCMEPSVHGLNESINEYNIECVTAEFSQKGGFHDSYSSPE